MPKMIYVFLPEQTRLKENLGAESKASVTTVELNKDSSYPVRRRTSKF
jgi:hypothetical protein